MARQTNSKKSLPNSAREQFFIYLYGYLTHNGFSKLARALAREARFSPNIYPSLDYIEQWWSLMWPVYQELSEGAPSDNEFTTTSAQMTSNMTNLRSLKFPPNIRDATNESVNPSLQIANQHILQQRGPQSIQIQGRPNLAAQSLAQQQALNQAMWAQSLGTNPAQMQRQQDEQNKRLQMSQRFNQQQEILQRLQHHQQQEFQQQQQLLHQEQLQHQYQMNQMQPTSVAAENERDFDGDVRTPNETRNVPPLKQKTSTSSINKVLKQKQQGKPKPMGRRQSSNVKQPRRLATPFQEVFTDTPTSDTGRRASHIKVKLRSPLPILIPGQEPLKAHRRVSSSKPKVKTESKKSISSLRIPSPSPTNPLTSGDIGFLGSYGQSTGDVNQSVVTQGQFQNATQVQQGLNSAGNANNYIGNGFSDIFSDFSQSSIQASFPPTLFHDSSGSTIEPVNNYLAGSVLATGLTENYNSTSEVTSLPLLASNNFADAIKVEQKDMGNVQFSGMYNNSKSVDTATAPNHSATANITADPDAFANYFPESSMTLPFQ